MKDNLILQDKNYISAKQAAEIFGYASDYIGQLCRAGKLECKMIGRSWFVTKESITKHKSIFNPEVTVKKNIESPVLENKIVESKVEAVSTVADTTIPEARPTVASEIIPEKISAVPFRFSLPNKISEEFITSTPNKKSLIDKELLAQGFYSKLAGASVICVVSLLILVNSIDSNTKLFVNTNEFISKNISFRNIANVVGITNIVKDFNGIAVVPSSNSAQDEMVKDKIRASFSDDVEITPDETGNSGIITPVFRKATGDDFVYVLVPVNESDSARNNVDDRK